MASAAASAGTAAAPALKRDFRVDDEAHIAHVDFYAADAFQQRRFQTEGETVDFKGLVVVGRLIQSQGETGAASAAGGQIDADAGFGLVGEKGLKFLPGSIGKMNHVYLQKKWVWVKIGTVLVFVNGRKALFLFFVPEPSALYKDRPAFVYERAARRRSNPSSRSAFRSSTSSRPMA